MFFYALDLLGTFAFAISGVLAAINKRMDAFGIFIIAFVTAVGGGTLRDVLIGRTPVSWMYNLTYIYTIALGVLLAVLLRKRIDYLRTSLFFFDTIGLGVFTLIGIKVGIETQLHPVISIALGAISASFGGVIRDILCNEIPVIFRKEIYATACIAGGVVYFLLNDFLKENWLYICTVLVIVAIRLFAVKYKLKLPALHN